MTFRTCVIVQQITLKYIFYFQLITSYLSRLYMQWRFRRGCRSVFGCMGSPALGTKGENFGCVSDFVPKQLARNILHCS
jgi:hypothetical protein